MQQGLFYAGSVLVPLVFGLVPAFLPAGSPAVLRWSLWLATLMAVCVYGFAMNDAPASFRMLAWAVIAVSAILSFIVLVAETGRPRRTA